MATTIAAHQVALGHNVIADAANYLEAGRSFWRRAAEAGTPLSVIHVICSNAEEHRRRIEHMTVASSAPSESSWPDVLRRADETEPWHEPHLVLDTMAPIDANLEAALDSLRESSK